ncbi:MAG: ABC transporter permease [Ferruginibacter sp.]
MLKLFKIEWLKIREYKTFWALFIIFLVMDPLAFYFIASKYMESHGGGQQEVMIKAFLGSPFVFPKVWQFSAWLGGLFFVMIGMLYILLITNEVQYRTHRQNIIDGWSRMDFLKAKLSLLIFFVLTSTAVVFISGLLIGLVYTEGSYDIFEQVYYVGYFAMMATIYLMSAFLIGILVKRTGLSIIIYFALVCIVDNVLWLILTLKNSQFGYFLPLECADSLVPNPFKPTMMEKRTVSDIALISTIAAYALVFGYVIINYFRKSDLKT